MLGAGRYEVSTDGITLTVTTEGMGVKGPFKTRAVFERVSPDRPLCLPVLRSLCIPGRTRRMRPGRIRQNAQNA